MAQCLVLVSFSLQCYERSSKAIKQTSGKEKKYWAEVKADMISDEEKVDDTYVQHPPAYRSDQLNRFIQKLDERLNSTPSHHARHPRVLGSPTEKPISSRAKPWMISDQSRNESMEEEGLHVFDQELYGPSNDEELECSDE